jgi:hypothetical protein
MDVDVDDLQAGLLADVGLSQLDVHDRSPAGIL